MLKGVDLTNVNSRRAYPLNSRASWVEQTHHHGNCVYVENRVLGPAEYSPKRANERHVGSPSLEQRSRRPQYGNKSKFIEPDDVFSSNLSIDRCIHPRQSAERPHSPGSYTIVDDVVLQRDGSFYERTEAATVFHDYDKRLALDPNRRYCATPGNGLAHDSLLLTHSTSGITVPTKVHFGPEDIPFGERCPVKAALPTYFPDFDSNALCRTVKLSKISPTARKTFADMVILKSLREEQPESPIVLRNTRERREYAALRSPTSPLALSLKPSPVRMPILRTRKPPPMKFDSSCYKVLTKDQVELNPKSIARLAQVGLFSELLTQKRHYDSALLHSRITEKIKRVAL